MTDALYTVEARVGRLIEARVRRLSTAEDVDAYGRAIANLALRAQSIPVLCADHRPVAIYPQAVTDRLVEAFRPNNGRFARIAILVKPSNATLTLQLRRLAREAGFEPRKVFAEAADAIAHLAPSLDETEARRLRVFLAEP